MRIIIALTLLFSCYGCRNLAQVGGDVPGDQTVKPPVINVNIPQRDDEKLKDDIKETINDKIKISNQSLQNKMSGLINAQDTRFANEVNGIRNDFNGKVTGIESKVNLQNEVSINTKAELNLKVAETLKLIDNLQLQINNQLEVNSDIKIKLQLLRDLEIKLGEIQAAANVQAGLLNNFNQKIEKLEAGRDINYLPKEVVYIILSIMTSIIIITIVIAKNIRDKAHELYLLEKKERQYIHNLLTEILADKDQQSKMRSIKKELEN